MLLTPQIAARQPLTGPEQVLYRFKGGKDGVNPIAGLTNEGYRALYRFKGGADGAYPFTGVIAKNGALYGVAYGGGGGTGCGTRDGTCGTVYEVTTAGKEHVLAAAPVAVAAAAGASMK
jgi:hypothetical protein